jgi:hypothetical protein
MDIKDPKLFAAFDKFAEWLSLPRHFSKYTEEQLQEKGVTSDLVELLKLRYKKDFAEHFCVDPKMLVEWEKHPDMQAKIKSNWKSWTKKLTPGVMGKFYDKLMVEADPGRMNIWMKVVEEEGKDEGKVNVNIGIDNILKSMQEDGDFKQENK